MAERGHVLWLMALLLGVLAGLALTGLQTAAMSGFAVQADVRALHQRQRAEAIVAAVLRQPLPSARDVSAVSPWSPQLAVGHGLIQQGAVRSRMNYVDASAMQPTSAPLSGMPDANTWRWQLQRLPDVASDSEEGTDVSAFPQLQPQRWQLDVLVREGAAPASGWRLNYRQQAMP